jgi:hypothetical protein
MILCRDYISRLIHIILAITVIISNNTLTMSLLYIGNTPNRITAPIFFFWVGLGFELRALHL